MGPFESNQLHDFNPGDLNVPGEPNYFMDGGLFWTLRVPEESIEVHPGRGDASFVLSEFSLLDYFTVANAIFRFPAGPDPIPATASLDVEWTGIGEREKVRNEAADFGGQYENAAASLLWSAANEQGYSFSTAGSSETNVTHALVAHVQTGSFHRGTEKD